MKTAIHGIGLVGGFGIGAPALKRVLMGDRVKPQTLSIATRDGTVAVPCLVADTSPLAGYIPSRQLRRMNHYVRLGLLAAFGAMDDAGLLGHRRPGRMGIIVATANGATGNHYAFQYPYENKEEICGSPIRFSNSVHNAAAAYIAMALSETGPNLSVTHDVLSFPSALMTARVWLQQRRVDAVLIGAVDELNHAHAYAWHMNNTAPPDSDRQATAAPMAGEGACFFVLKTGAESGAYASLHEAAVARRGSKPLAAPAGDWYFGAHRMTDASATPGSQLPSPPRQACYAHLYGDLSIDNAVDTAIAAMSLENHCIYPGYGPNGPSTPLPLSTDSTIVCVKEGAGRTWGWISLKKRGLPS